MDVDEQGFQTKTEVEKIIQELKDSNVNFENYKTYVSKIQNTSKIISAQIESLIREYRAVKKKLDERVEEKDYQRAKEEKLIPLDANIMGEELLDIFRDAYSWRALEVQMHSLIFAKISQVLDDAKALDIKRDALREMREMETKRNEMFLSALGNNTKMVEDVVNNKLKAIDDKIMNSVKFILKEAVSDKKETLILISQILKDVNIDNTEISKKLVRAMNEDKEIDEELKKPIGDIKIDKTEVRYDKKIKKEKSLDALDAFDEPLDDDDDDDDDDDSNDGEHIFKGEGD